MRGLDRVYALNPSDYVAVNGAALTSSHIGDVDGVRHDAALAESRHPGLYDFVDIALAYQRINDIDSARRIFELAGAGDVSTIPNLQWQFWMHMAVEDYDAAIAFLERTINENFPFPAASYLYSFSDHSDYDPIRSHPTFDVLVRTVSQPLQGRSGFAGVEVYPSSCLG